VISSDPKVAVRASILLAVRMFAPMIAHNATRLITREGWANTLLRPDFRSGRWRYYLTAWFLPIVATPVGGAIYYLLFPEHFDPSMAFVRELGLISIGSGTEPWAFFLTGAALAVASPLSPLLLMSLGEEFGWRVYLLPKLMPLGGRRAVLLVAVIHGIWHWPAILMGYEYGFGYWGEPVVGPLLFLVFVLCLSAFLAWVTLRSGGVWPAALGHGAVNASPMLMFPFLVGDADRLIGPIPVGIVGGLGYIVLGLLVFFSARALAPIARPRPVASGAVQVGLQPIA
jgi:membrane protease YdiL (CAAX protease family)